MSFLSGLNLNQMATQFLGGETGSTRSADAVDGGFTIAQSGDRDSCEFLLEQLRDHSRSVQENTRRTMDMIETVKSFINTRLSTPDLLRPQIQDVIRDVEYVKTRISDLKETLSTIDQHCKEGELSPQELKEVEKIRSQLPQLERKLGELENAGRELERLEAKLDNPGTDWKKAALDVLGKVGNALAGAAGFLLWLLQPLIPKPQAEAGPDQGGSTTASAHGPPLSRLV